MFLDSRDDKRSIADRQSDRTDSYKIGRRRRERKDGGRNAGPQARAVSSVEEDCDKLDMNVIRF